MNVHGNFKVKRSKGLKVKKYKARFVTDWRFETGPSRGGLFLEACIFGSHSKITAA